MATFFKIPVYISKLLKEHLKLRFLISPTKHNNKLQNLSTTSKKKQIFIEKCSNEKIYQINKRAQGILYNYNLPLLVSSFIQNPLKKFERQRNYNHSHHNKFYSKSGLSLALIPWSLMVVYCSKKDKEDKILQRELILSAKSGNVSKLNNLIKLGVNVNGRHPYGWCPIHTAAINGHAHYLQILLENGADPNIPDKFSNIFQVARDNRKSPFDVEEIREDEFSDILSNKQTFNGSTALHYAVLANSHECVKILINFGADPNLVDEYNHTPEEYSKDIGMGTLMKKLGEIYLVNKKKLDMEARRNFPLEQRVAQRIIGQENAINAVCGAIRRKENGWYDEEHPLVFLFLGSSGIGKTELAKQVAEYLKKGKESGFIRLDMSEYQQKHEVAKFIGSPPGYIGHDDGGQLTKKLTKNPEAVVLFDEIEKAHPDILTIMLQLFDEGRLTDGKGKTIECKNAIFIMTSNLASDEIADYSVHLREEAKQKQQQVDKSSKDEKRVELVERITISKRFKEKIVQPILKRHFQRDEFLGRINEIVYFVPFTRIELIKLVTVELEKWAKQAKNKNKIELTWDSAILDVLADGYNVHYGARSVKHEVERRIINQIALAYENGLITESSSVHITVGKPSVNEKETSCQEIPIKIQVKNMKEDKFLDIDPAKFIKDPLFQ